MPHDVRAAAVTQSTFRKRRRSRESVISVVTDATVAGHFALHVTAHAPSHAQRRDLLDLRHALHVAVTGRARLRVTPHARLQRRDARLTGDRRRIVTVHARDLVLSRMDVVAEEDRLTRSLKVAGVADDRSLIPL